MDCCEDIVVARYKYFPPALLALPPSGDGPGDAAWDGKRPTWKTKE